MSKCRDNLRRKQKIAKREKAIQKWCENYVLKTFGLKGNVVGNTNFFPHPWRSRKQTIKAASNPAVYLYHAFLSEYRNLSTLDK